MIEPADTTERFVLAPGGMWLDLLTGRRFPAIFGADDGDESDDGDDGDGDDDDGDGEGGDDAELEQLAAAFTKANRAGAKKALRKLARDYGFGSRAELESFLKANAKGRNDDGDDEGDDDDAGGDTKQKRRSRIEPVQKDESALLARERKVEIREALAQADLNPRKSKIAAATLAGLVDLTDPDLDGEDIEDAVEQLKSDEPGWFLDDGDGDEGSGGGRVVPGASNRSRKQAKGKSPEELAIETYEARKRASRRPSRLQPSTR